MNERLYSSKGLHNIMSRSTIKHAIEAVGDKGIDTDLELYDKNIEKAVKNGREVLVVKPKTWEEYFTPEELEEMRRPEFMDEVERLTREAWQEG